MADGALHGLEDEPILGKAARKLGIDEVAIHRINAPEGKASFGGPNAAGRRNYVTSAFLKEAHFVGGRDGRVETLQVPDVLAVDIDVDEPVEVAIVGQQLLLQALLHLRSHDLNRKLDRLSASIRSIKMIFTQCCLLAVISF